MALPRALFFGVVYECKYQSQFHTCLDWKEEKEKSGQVWATVIQFTKRIPSFKVKMPISMGIGDRIMSTMMYSAVAHALQPSARVYLTWERTRSNWDPLTQHGGWANDLTKVSQHVTFPSNVCFSEPSPVDAVSLVHESRLVQSILPTAGYVLFPALLGRVSHTQFQQAYEAVAKQLRITHPVVELVMQQNRLSSAAPSFGVVHVRGGDKRNMEAAFLSSTEHIFEKVFTKRNKWFVVSDDDDLLQKLPRVKAMCARAPVAEHGSSRLDQTLRDLSIVMHASIIIQHSPNGWSAFSHVASLVRRIPIINTFPTQTRHHNFLQGIAPLPSFFFASDQLDQFARSL